MPRSRKDAAVFLALAASTFDPRQGYSEEAVNDHLIEWRGEFANPFTMDHVTLRRTLVDFSLLIRDPSGTTYTANQAVINAAIEPAARVLQPEMVHAEMLDERERRKRASVSRGGLKPDLPGELRFLDPFDVASVNILERKQKRERGPQPPFSLVQMPRELASRNSVAVCVTILVDDAWRLRQSAQYPAATGSLAPAPRTRPGGRWQ